MVATASAKRARRAPLSRDKVVRVAIDLADKSGIEGLSMRRLALDLGVEAMSLYHWFPSKEALLGAMIDAIYAEMELPAASDDWRADMRTSALSAKDAFMRHSWAAPLVGALVTPFGARFRWMNALLGRLRTAGFSANMTHHAYHALDSHIVGFVLWVLPYLRAADDMPALARDFAQSAELSDLPYAVEHIGEHAAEDPDSPSEFEFGLSLILDGLERLRTTD